VARVSCVFGGVAALTAWGTARTAQMRRHASTDRVMARMIDHPAPLSVAARRSVGLVGDLPRRRSLPRAPGEIARTADELGCEIVYRDGRHRHPLRLMLEPDEALALVG